ncbi:MAG: tetratricopeptide repeat protein [Desulfobacterales bacterium]|nr:tetratricopeptide repeat protein [Desulfobacterales bacterium]
MMMEQTTSHPLKGHFTGTDLDDLFTLALEHHRQGRTKAAREGYRRVIALRPDHVDALNFLGVLEQETGAVVAAVSFLERAARLDPGNEIVLNNLGNALKAHGQTERAEACYRRAVQLNPAEADPPFNLAALLQSQGRLDEALQWYQRALDRSPDDAGVLNNVASIHQARGDAVAAEATYRRVLKRQPDHLRVRCNLAKLLLGQERHDEAAECCRRALSTAPDYLEALLCLGRACRETGRLDEAQATCERAVAVRPDLAEPHFNLGNVFKDRGRFHRAGDCYQQALAIAPDFAKAWCNLGSIHREEGRNAAAMACYEKALAFEPDFAEVYNNMGILLTETGRIGEALDCCRKAQALRADFAESYNNLARALKYSGRAAESVAWYRKSLALEPKTAFVHSNLLYCLAYIEVKDASPETVSRAHRQWASVHGAPVDRVCRSHPNRVDPDRRLRIGYLSPDFRKHPVATFMAPVLAGHDPSTARIVCFSDVRKGDKITEKLHRLAGEWVDTAGLSDDQAIDAIRSRQIDILVDLAGHTAGNRMPLFSRRAAPVQVTYLGYPNTTGLAAMDYRITDHWADPPGLTEALHTETLVRLPDGFLCYAPPDDAPPVEPPPHAARGYITFGSFNNLAKFNGTVAALWAKVLHAVPRSRLLMKFKTLSDPEVRQHVRGLFAAHGIGRDRLAFHGFLPSAGDHFALYHGIDIALDTFPYNGTTTTCEALWMGVPVIALAGGTHAARVGVSILTGLGLSELVSGTAEDFVARAVALAGDFSRLAALRGTLRARMAASPLLDARGFARRLETAYRDMWRRWCRSRARDKTGADHSVLSDPSDPARGDKTIA